MNAHHELAIFPCLFPATPSCTPASSSLFLCPFTIWVFSAWWVFLCLSLLVPTSVQGPCTRRGVWFALSCADEAYGPESRISERPLFMLCAARPLQLKFKDAGFVYVPMVCWGQTRQPSIDRRPLCLVEVLVCYFLLWSCGNRRRFKF